MGGGEGGVHVARFLPLASGVPNQYFSRPPLWVASAWERASRAWRERRDVVGGMRERKTIMSVWGWGVSCGVFGGCWVWKGGGREVVWGVRR